MKEEAINILKNYHQEHILNYLNLLSEKEQTKLEEQILRIDFETLKKLYENTKPMPTMKENKIEPACYTNKLELSKEKTDELETIGEKIISAGKYAVITMAGGQGTRLGHSGPKGTYQINTINGSKYLFEIIVDTLKRAQTDYKVTVPWYIMTSRENNDETIKFLEEHQYFGYDKTKVKFFMQGELPLLSTDGKVILDEKKQIKEASDGTGGIYEAVFKSGMLQEMKQNGIEWIFVSNVDNILSNFVDPLLLGLTISENKKIGAKSVVKVNPQEKAGVFCQMNGKTQIVEYIDLPEKMANQRNEKGELVYSEINIANYLYNISILEDLAKVKLPYHAALKKSNYLDESGNYITVENPNVYKFEAFIFDAFERCDNITILRVKREDEFAPLKNKEGVDSTETATKLYNEKMKERRVC